MLTVVVVFFPCGWVSDELLGVVESAALSALRLAREAAAEQGTVGDN